MRAGGSRAAAPFSRSWAAALSVAAGLLVATIAAAETPAGAAHDARTRESWTWRAPGSARRIAWPDPSRAAASESDATGPLDVAPGEIVLIPVDAGDVLRIDGDKVHIGLGSGAAELYPDVIAWQSAPAPRTLRIPTWSFTRFVALRSDHLARARVQIAVGRHDALTAHRLDAEVHAGVHGAAELPVTAPLAERRRLLSLSGLMRLSQAALGAGSGRAFAARGAGAWLAYSHWLEQSWMARPLEEPFFVALPLESSGGQLLPRETPEGEEDWRLLQAGESLTLQRSPDWDVLSFAVRAQALGQSRVQLWRGNTLLHDAVFQIPRRAEHSERWTPPRILRAVAAGPGEARLVVVEGRVRARVDARRAEQGAFESASVHRPRRHRAIVPELRRWPSWFADLVAYEADPSEAGLQRLARHLTAPETSPAAAGLIWVFALPRLAGRASIPSALARLWAASASLPPDERSALFASVLARLQDTLPNPVEVATCPSLFDAQSGIDAAHEAALLRTQLEAVMAIRDGRPPRAALELEQHAALRSEDEELREAARRGWQRAAPWKALSAPQAPSRVLQRRPFDVNQPSGLCQNMGARGLRWWIVPDRPTPIEVLDLGGTHSTLRLAALDGDDLTGSIVQIDGLPAHVQPILGEVSRVAVKPGVHTIVRSAGPKVIARIPRLGLSPCSELLETERWFSLERQLVFELPALETASVASIIVDPTSLESAAEVEVGVADTRVTAWLRPPASGEIEIAIPAGARELVVRSGAPLLVRARVRMHPGRRSDLFAVPRPAPLPEVERIGEIARLTAALRATVETEAGASLRLARAEHLFALGYRELAALDGLRAGRPELGMPRSLPGALFLPDSPAPVVPLGVAARAPLLSLADPGLSAQALRHHRLGQSAAALELLTAARLPDSDRAEALLAALLAAELGDPEAAARTFERLARAHDNAALFEAAAEQYERLALETRRLDLGRRGYLMAKLARGSATASDIVARFEALADWVTPSLAALGRDSLSIIAPLDEPEDLSIGQRVRAALLLPPPAARRLAGESTFNVRRFRGQSLWVESLCHNREGPSESCQADLFVDGVAAACPELPAAHTSTPARCQLSLGPAARELSVRLPPEGRPLGWALLQQAEPDSPAGALAPVTWQQSYTRLDSEAPIVLTLAGPGVLRIQARGLGAGSGPLIIHDRALEPAAGAGRVRLSEVALPEQRLDARDPDGVALEVSPEAQLDQVLEPGIHEITLSTQSGPLLIRPESMELSRLPDFEPPLEAAAPGSGEAGSDAGTRELELPLPASAAEPWPLSASAELGAQDRDLAESDADASDRYVEMALVLRKELLDNRLWIEAKGLGRLRAGPASAGAAMNVTSSPSGLWPGIFASGEVTVQPGFDALGASANAGLRHRLPLGPRFMLLPEASVTWRRVDPAARARSGADNRVDNDVYSAYALRRTHSIDAKLVLSQRPFIDTTFRHAFGVRLNPGARGLDRLEAKSELDLLPGSGWAPWLSLAASASHRPASELRQSAFTRFTLSPAATLWRWLDEGRRVRTDLSLSVFVDAPNPSGSRAGFFAGVLVGYDFLLGEGLADYRTSQRPFRARLEEGGPGAAPDPAPNDTYWAEAVPP